MANLTLTRTELKAKLAHAQAQFRATEAASKAADARANDEFSQVDYESDMAEFEVESIERRYGLTEKAQAASKAQAELVAVCREIISTDPATAKRFAANQALLDTLWAKYDRYTWARERIISLCLSLAI